MSTVWKTALRKYWFHHRHRRHFSFLRVRKRFYKSVNVKDSKGDSRARRVSCFLATISGHVAITLTVKTCPPRCCERGSREHKSLGGIQCSNQNLAGEYLIQLDKKQIKTPLGNYLYAPGKLLASAVATEWQAQKENIEPHTMHLTSLCNTCIDNPRRKTKQEIIQEMLSFLHSDTICTRAEEPEALVEFQKQGWDPLLHWFCHRFDVRMKASVNLFDLEQTAETVQKMKDFLSSKNEWQLTGLQFAIDSVKSFVIPFAVIEKELSIDAGVYLSRLEHEFQIQRWGNVEWYHDVELMNQRAQLAAGTLFYNLSSDCNDNDLSETSVRL